jgi:hypothetical protein
MAPRDWCGIALVSNPNGLLTISDLEIAELRFSLPVIEECVICAQPHTLLCLATAKP